MSPIIRKYYFSTEYLPTIQKEKLLSQSFKQGRPAQSFKKVRYNPINKKRNP